MMTATLISQRFLVPSSLTVATKAKQKNKIGKYLFCFPIKKKRERTTLLFVRSISYAVSDAQETLRLV